MKIANHPRMPSQVAQTFAYNAQSDDACQPALGAASERRSTVKSASRRPGPELVPPAKSVGFFKKALGLVTLALAYTARPTQAALIPSGAICYPWGSRDVQNVTYGIMACGTAAQGGYATRLYQAETGPALQVAQKLRSCADAQNATLTRGSQPTEVFLGLTPLDQKSISDGLSGYPAATYTSIAPSGPVYDCMADSLNNAFGL